MMSLAKAPATSPMMRVQTSDMRPPNCWLLAGAQSTSNTSGWEDRTLTEVRK